MLGFQYKELSLITVVIQTVFASSPATKMNQIHLCRKTSLIGNGKPIKAVLSWLDIVDVKYGHPFITYGLNNGHKCDTGFNMLLNVSKCDVKFHAVSQAYWEPRSDRKNESQDVREVVNAI